MTYRPPKKPALALEADIVQDNLPAEVYPNIYIGSIHAAFNQEALLNLGITHILNASRLPSTFPKSFTYLSIDIRDKDEANILACIPAANIFIEAGIESGGVMVHCYGGRSRSAALVAAFLMSSFEWTYGKALQTIQAARPVAHINSGFEIQLKAYAHARYDVYLAQQVLLQGRVRALQCYRSIVGETADELLIKANERKKFGSLHTVGSNGNTSSRRHCTHKSGNHPPGSKRSWGNAKDEDEIEDHNDSSGEDAEEEDNLMECAMKSYNAPHPHREVTQTIPVASSPPNLSSILSPRQHTVTNGVVTTAHILTSHDPSQQGGSSESQSQSSKLRRRIPLMDPRSPHLRLSRPGNASVRVIPPLRGLERIFCCAWCQCHLFNLASVIRTDLRVQPLPESATMWAGEKIPDTAEFNQISFPPQGFPQTPLGPNSQEKDSASYLMPAPSPRGINPTFMNATYPDDAKLSSFHVHSDKSSNPHVSRQNVGYKSPPKTSRSKGAKSFDFDLPSETESNIIRSPRGNSFKPPHDEPNSVKLLEEDATQDENRVSSPMEISDEKQPLQTFLNPEVHFKQFFDEKSSFAEPTLSSRRPSASNFRLQLNETNHHSEEHPPSLSRPTSSYRQRETLSHHQHSSRPPSSSTYHSQHAQSHPQPPPISPSESPRIAFPHAGRESFSYPSPRNRPQSAEKRRWLARVNLLKADNSEKYQDHDRREDNPMNQFVDQSPYRSKHDEKVAKLSQDDDVAMTLGFGREKYIHLEYLEWMGEELLSSSIDSGELKCGHCSRVIGSWTWTPTPRQTLDGILQAPVIRVHKNVVHEVDIPLDQTPASTPRVDDQMEDGHAII